MTDRENLDAQWCAQQDAAAVGDALDPVVPPEVTDPRWETEEAFYAALEQQGQGAPSPADLDLIESVLAAEVAPPAQPQPSNNRGILVAAFAVAAAVLLVWFAWPADLTAIGTGSWVAQDDGSAHGNGGELPQAIWLVAGAEACGTVDGATLCAEEGTVVRVVVQGPDEPPRVDVERGTVTVREGTWTVVTPKGERTLASGESVTVEPEVVARADPRPAIVPEPPEPPEPEPEPEPEYAPEPDPEPDEPEEVEATPDTRKPDRVPTADAATTLWTQMTFPAAPPTACSATTQLGSAPVRRPTPNWNSENIMLLTVLLPATNAPKPPIIGAKIGHTEPTTCDTPSARTIGIDSATSAPEEKRNTCTIGTVKMSAADAPIMVLPELAQART